MNKIQIRGLPANIKELLISELTISNPKFQEASSAGRSTYNISPFIYNFTVLAEDSLMIPRGYKSRLLKILKETNTPAKVIDNRTKPKPKFDIDSSMISYRPYQYDAVMDMVSVEEGVLVAPAGSGKTVIGISLVPLFGLPTLWLTHTKALAKQALDRVDFFLPDLTEEDKGLIGSGKWDVGKMFTVAMVQTLARRPMEAIKIMNNFGMLILDEAHHCPASTFLKVVGYFNPYRIYGLTATPYRRDKLQALMYHALGDLIARISIEEVEKHGGMMRPKVRYRAFRHPRTVDENIVSVILRDNIISNDKRNGMIVSDVLSEAHKGNFCIVTSDRKKHCETLHDLISIGWEKTGIATGNYTKKKVEEAIEKLENGETTVLVCTNQMLGEGFDFPPLNRAFIASPFRAEAKCEQLVGRIQRPAPGKRDAIIYDYVDVNIGVLHNQFHSKYNNCRYKVYERLGLDIEPF